MAQSTATFVHDGRLGVRFGSAQMALQEWVASMNYSKRSRALERSDGSFLFIR